MLDAEQREKVSVRERAHSANLWVPN
jgi:hypothetical protein